MAFLVDNGPGALMFEYVGNLHIHTTYSDGHGSVRDVVRAARGVGLDFVGLADHYHLLSSGIPAHEAGWRDSVLVCVGTELHGAHSHYLAWGVDGASLSADEAAPQRTIDAVRAHGGIGFLAHPFDPGTPLHDGGHAFAWRDWSVHGYTGLGIWNLGTEYKRRSQTLRQAAVNRALLRHVQIDPVPEDLRRWDELNRTRRVVGIGESDNHAVPIRAAGGLLRTRVFPYATAFRCINTHVLLAHPMRGAAAADTQALYDALAAGRCFVANHHRGNARGFRCMVRGPRCVGQMGDSVAWQPGLRLQASAPARGMFRVIADGRVAFQLRGRGLRWPVPGPGIYRVEVRRRDLAGRWRAWIFGNHLRVTA